MRLTPWLLLLCAACAPPDEVDFVEEAVIPPPCEDRVTGNDHRLDIPDATGRAVESSAWLSGAGTVSHVLVSVDLQHPYRGDLRVELIAPSGRAVVLKQPNVTDAADDVIYRDLDIQALAGEPAGGTWKLRIRDVRTGDAGALRSWSIRLPCLPDDIPTTP